MAVPPQKMSLGDFLAWENAQDARHEFWRGEAFAMGGVRRVQGLVSGNLAAALKSHLKGSRCRAFAVSMKVQVGEDALFYPDNRRVEVFRRNERGNFELVDQTGADELVLDSVGLRLAMAEVFDGVEVRG